MDVIAAFAVIFVSLMWSIYKNIFILYPLLLGLAIFIMICLRKGFELKPLLLMALKGSGKVLMIIRIFVLIGAITAIWRASGTVAYIVYYGIQFMHPQFFILSAFILTGIVSFLLGTSFGTVGTIGVVLIIMAKSGNVNISAVAGAIIAGAYFGDRCSPMSSSAILVATVTDTALYKNIKNMFRTTALPLALSLVFYMILSIKNPLVMHNSNIGPEILQVFNISFAAILPAAIILILAFFKVDVKFSMSISILLGVVIAIFMQHQSIMNILKYIVFGYSVQDAGFFLSIMEGGGIISMVKISFIVLASSAYSGIFEGTGILKQAETFIKKLSNKTGIFFTTILTSIAAASFGCTQALAVILTDQLIKKNYDSAGISSYGRAIDLEDTVIVISPLIPWNIAGALPAAMLSANSSFIVYAFYLYLIPIIGLLYKKQRQKIYFLKGE